MNSKSTYKKVSNGATATNANDDTLSNASSYGSVSSFKQDNETNDKYLEAFTNINTTPTNAKPVRTVLKYSDRKNLFEQQEPSSPIQQQLDQQQQLMLSSNSLELHYYVYHNDIKKIKEIIENLKKKYNYKTKIISEHLSIKDVHDNTPLHLCCMLGQFELAKLLIDEGAIVKTRNKQMWTPLNESISYGNRELIRIALKKFETEVEQIMEDTKPKVIEALLDMENFYVEILWDFVSWIPFISRFLPSDVCKLHKLGSKLRVDCTLGDIAGSKRNADGSLNKNSENSANSMGASISPFSWERGDLSFLFDIEKLGDKNSITFMDNTRKTFTIIDKTSQSEFEHDLDKEIDLMLSKEMVFLKLNTKAADFNPCQVGWFSKRDKIEMVNGYNCQFYDVNNLYIVTKLRVEHLSDEELKKREEKEAKLRQQLNSQKTITTTSNTNTNNNNNNNNNNENSDITGLDNVDMEDAIKYRPSLPPPPLNSFSWNDYINSKEGEWPCLGRKLKCKESRKEFKAQLAMSQEFPLTVNDLNKLLDALVPLAKFRKLKEFINLKLPPGFPVKIDIPIVPAISAKVCFQNFKKQSPSQHLFQVPSDYKEELLIIENKTCDSSTTTTESTSVL